MKARIEHKIAGVAIGIRTGCPVNMGKKRYCCVVPFPQMDEFCSQEVALAAVFPHLEGKTASCRYILVSVSS